MKNLLKKISAVAMAFTLLGTGTAISKNSPKPTNTLTAHAAYNHNCCSYKYQIGSTSWIKVDSGTDYKYSVFVGGYVPNYTYDVYVGSATYKCAVCGNTFSETQYKKVPTYYYNIP